MNKNIYRPLSWEDFLKIRERLPGSTLVWTIKDTLSYGPVKWWLMSPDYIVFGLEWSKSNPEGEWATSGPNGCILGFKRSSVTLRISRNGDVVITVYDRRAVQLVDYRIKTARYREAPPRPHHRLTQTPRNTSRFFNNPRAR